MNNINNTTISLIPNFFHLPKEITIDILSYLQLKEIPSVALTCKSFKKLIPEIIIERTGKISQVSIKNVANFLKAFKCFDKDSSPQFKFKELSITDYPSKPNKFRRFKTVAPTLKTCATLEKMTIQLKFPLDDDDLAIFKDIPNLKEFHLENGSLQAYRNVKKAEVQQKISAKAFNDFLLNHKNLVNITLIKTNMVHIDVNSIFQNCTKIETLHIYCNPGQTVAFNAEENHDFLHLKSIVLIVFTDSSLTEKSFIEIANNAKNLESVVIGSLVTFTDKTVSKFAQCKNLKKINLNPTEITDEALYALTNCKSLQSVSFPFSGNSISEKGVSALIQNCSNLKNINFNTEKMNDSEIQILKENHPKINFEISILN